MAEEYEPAPGQDRYDPAGAGQDYAGRRYKYSTTYEGKDASERIVAELAPGTRTVCYCNPKKPKKAVLVAGRTLPRGLTWFLGLAALAGFTFFAAGLWNEYGFPWLLGEG